LAVSALPPPTPVRFVFPPPESARSTTTAVPAAACAGVDDVPVPADRGVNGLPFLRDVLHARDDAGDGRDRAEDRGGEMLAASIVITREYVPAAAPGEVDELGVEVVDARSART
jgi:hypothetical protein